MQVFVIINKDGIMKNAYVNVKNRLTKEDVMKNFFGILVIANVINHVTIIWEYLDYENCKCRKNLVDKLVEECSENIDGNEMIYNTTLNDYEKVCNYCTIYIVIFVIFFIISISISSAFIHFHWYLKRSGAETVIH